MKGKYKITENCEYFGISIM